MAEERITVEKVTEVQHFHACEEVQKRAWGMDDILVVPIHLLITAQKNGGLVLGAFNEEGEMVGFLFGFLGATRTRAGDEKAPARLRHCSHMMGIVPEYQAKGVGYQLKLRQAEHVHSQGLDLVTWTYDPLESLNANLNVCKLGVVCDTYLRDTYGEMTTALHVGLPSDRFQVEWWITSRRVEERIEKGGVKLRLDEVLDHGAKQVNVATVGPDGFLWPSVYDLLTTSKDAVIEVPANFQSIKSADMSLATEWRQHTREIFTHYFDAGYTMTEFISEIREGRRSSYYLLQQDFVIR